jgi:predicted AlkP superfamily phosphohydrolase/phosphomutase
MFPMKCPPLTGVVINLRGRQPEGVVAPEAYESLRDRLMQQLADLRDPNTGERIVQSVYKREDLYRGEYLERAPDIIIWCNHLYKEGPFAEGPLVNQVPYDELQQVPGSHDEKGIFLVKGPGIAAGKTVEGAHLIDVPPTILQTMGLPIPNDMDGKVLQDIYEAAHAPESIDLDLERQSAESYLSEDEEQLIKDKLKGWGYM